jgi:hypothetical protein
MVRSEQRSLERFTLKVKPDGDVFLCTGGEKHQIDEIYDISDSGIRFNLDHSVPLSSQVTIEYCDKKLKIEVYGRVAWCVPRKSLDKQIDGLNGFVLGVQLLSPRTLFALLQHKT